MELLALRTFQAVVEEGGILAASRRLNTVQSNVTTRVQRLEQELGTELFFRKGRGLSLTPSGRVLLEYAERMLRLEQQTSAAVRQVGESVGSLRVGSMESFAAIRLPQALREVRLAHPGLVLQIETGTSAELLQKVLAHKLDCAFVGGPVVHAELLTDELLVEELVLVKSRHHASPGQLILFREGCAYRERALAWQRESGHPLNEVMQLGTLEGLLGCVSVGLGCTLMPRAVVLQSRFVEDLSIESLPASLARVPTLMVRHRDALPMACFQTLSQAVANERPVGSAINPAG